MKRGHVLQKIGSAGPFLVIFAVSLLLFILIDLLQINNYTNSWVFLSKGNLLNILYQASINAIMAFAMTIVIIIAGIDLSVGSFVSIAGVLLCVLNANLGFNLFFSIFIVLAVGILFGMLNGFIIARFDIPPFVATLGAMIFIRGISNLLVNGEAVFNDSPAFLFIGNGKILSIPFPIFILIGLFALFHYLLKYSVFGRHVYSLGGNEEAAKLSGVKVGFVKIAVYALSGFAATVSGIILASRLGSGQPLSGNGYELDVITAVIIGGASFAGGVGTITGTLAGAVILGLISNGMNLLSIQPYLQWVIKGSLILLVVVFKQQIEANKGDHHLIVTEHKQLE